MPQLRICVTGAECTGKTTLARALAETLGVPLVPELVRDYFTDKARTGDATVFASDIIHAVELQRDAEQSAPADAPVVVLDTDLFTIAVWQRLYLGDRFKELEEMVERERLRTDRTDFYVLASPDIPFEHDGVRGAQAARDQMHPVFKAELERTGRRYVTVTGSVEQRLEQVLAALQEIHM